MIPRDFKSVEISLRTVQRPKDRFRRFYSKRSRARYDYDNKPEAVRRLLEHSIITKDQKLTFVKNSKAGCTAVSHLIFQYNHGVSFNGYIHGLHRPLLAFPENSTSFSIVRHPVSRFISAFLDIFVSQRNRVAALHFDNLTAFGFEKKDDLGYRFDVALDYVEATLAHSLVLSDHHFTPQYYNLGDGLIELSDLAWLENLEVDLKRIADLAGVSLGNPSDLTRERQNKGADIRFSPSRAQVKRIEQLYQRDFELYGY